VPDLFAPLCSVTPTKRRRFFWAAWWTSPPVYVPFKKPDASGGGVATMEEALAAAEARAGMPLALADPLWARAWMRVLRGERPWPSRESRVPRAARAPRGAEGESAASIWAVLGVSRDATLAELKAAYRQKVLKAHPDHGGEEGTFRRVVEAYEEAQRRLRRPRRKT
jgi:hypothetical protein